MTPEETQQQLEKLKEENRQLRRQLFVQETNKLTDKGKVILRKLVYAGSTFVAGKGLRDSLTQLYDELPHKVEKKTLAEVSSHVIWRITRIGLFAICAAIIPIFILMTQTFILSIQNEKLDYQNQLILNQNKRLDQQVQLDEGNRRSSFIFLMSNIMDKIDEELKTARNGSRKLSDELIGRIAAQSQALLPYRYLENDSLTPGPLSPERGQLLFALVNSLLDESTYDKIFEKSNFSYAELKQANFTGAYLRNINLEHAHFQDAVFSDANMELARLNNADLSGTYFENVYLGGAQLEHAKFSSAEIVDVVFEHANVSNVDFSKTRIKNSKFFGCRVDNVKLDSAEIEFALLEGAKFQSRDWLNDLDETKLKGWNSIRENYRINPEEVIVSSTQTDTLYTLELEEDSRLALMSGCERQVLDIVKSVPKVAQLIERTRRQGEQIIYLTEANPFGDADLGIIKDHFYLFRITTEDADFFSVLMQVQFYPQTGELLELPLIEGGEASPLEYSENMWHKLPEYCKIIEDPVELH